MLDLEKSEFLSDAQIREKAPCVFSKKASAEVSKHYTHIPTSKVINDMRTLGWDVVSAQEVAARKKETKGVFDGMVSEFGLTGFTKTQISNNNLLISTAIPVGLMKGYSRGKTSLQIELAERYIGVIQIDTNRSLQTDIGRQKRWEPVQADTDRIHRTDTSREETFGFGPDRHQ